MDDPLLSRVESRDVVLVSANAGGDRERDADRRDEGFALLSTRGLDQDPPF